MHASQRDLDYLHRGACLLRKQVVPRLNGDGTFIDKEIRLLLTSWGPTYCSKAALGDDVLARRVLNLYYDRGFAEILYRELLIHHSNVKSVWPRLYVMSKGQGNPLANVYPQCTRHWWPIVEDAFMSSAVRSSLVLTLERNREHVPWQQFVLSASLAFFPFQRCERWMVHVSCNKDE